MTKSSNTPACASELATPRIDWELFKEVRIDLLLFELNKLSEKCYIAGEKYRPLNPAFYKFENGEIKRYVEIKP